MTWVARKIIHPRTLNPSLKNKKGLILSNRADYVRFSTLNLCYDLIINNKIKGSVAELGVYKGGFAKNLNLLFSDRKLFLFDTFEGFDKKDINTELDLGLDVDQDFSDTSVSSVLALMQFPDKCIIKKGFFPQTSHGINETFCFVSIDTDLYMPILEGLRFFYPKLEKGGYIFVHDFNNDTYKGAKLAVMEFSKEKNISFVPIPDSYGTVVFTK